jgi:hypothetical protein
MRPGEGTLEAAIKGDMVLVKGTAGFVRPGATGLGM